VKSFSKVAAGGLLWLSFSALAFGDTIYFTSQTENVNEGGQFTAYLTSNPSQELITYCVDALNEISMPPTGGYSVNVVDLNNAAEVAADARYGQTAPSAFSYAVSVDNAPPASGTSAATPTERYAMAAWLDSQFIFPLSTATLAQKTTDDEIQNAIWTLLDATGATYSTCPAGVSTSTCTTGVDAEIADAQTWINAEITSGALASFESTVVLYSPTAINPSNTSTGLSTPARYNVGNQEQVGFITATPEPATLAMLGAGLVAIGIFRKRTKS
jgi:hypothetical protein